MAVLLVAGLASHAEPAVPLLRATTTKSLDEFSACFANEQERDGRPWAFLPTATGGTFTNAGANAAPGDFWLRVREGRSGARLELYAAGQSPEITEALNQCH